MFVLGVQTFSPCHVTPKASCSQPLSPHTEETYNTTSFLPLYFRSYSQTDEIVENLMDFLAKNQVSRSEEPRPVLLCGAHGAGKSTVLHHLLQQVCEEMPDSGNFSLVVMVDEWKTKQKDQFWQWLFHHLAEMCPRAVEKYGMDKVINILSVYSNKSNFLFLMDQNLQNPSKLVNLMPLMDHGTWVLSYQGVPEHSTFYRLLKMESLFEEQVLDMLRGIAESEEQYRMVSHLYKICNYKGLIDTPDMVHFFSKVCKELRDCVPFYGLIDRYICKNVPTIPQNDQNEAELTKLGRKAMDIIRLNKEYYSSEALADIDNSVKGALMECDMRNGFFFKYRVVQDYLAAMYVVRHTTEGCKFWLEQVNLFRRVFEIVCALWSREEGGIRRNLSHIKKYLEKLFEISKGSRRKKKEEKMEVDEAEDDDKDTSSQPSFVRWIFLANLAEEHQNNEDILLLLAQLLACKSSWLFKCKSLTEKSLRSLSLVFRHVKLTKELTIEMVSGPNVTMLTKLWVMLSGHEGVCSNTSVRLVIHHTEKNWFMYDKDLKLLPATVAKTTSPLFITKFVGPLLCSETEQFLRCFCMSKLDVLEAYIYDLDSLREVLGHQKELGSVFVKVNLRMEETHIPDTVIKLSSSLPLNLTITYFQDIQKLLNIIEPPHHLASLRIYKVYIHRNFNLDLRRFKNLKFLAIRFCETGKLPSIYLNEPQQENMEVHVTKKDRRVFGLPLEEWVLTLALKTYFPDSLERLLLRNLSFCNDSNILVLSKYWSGLPFQRLVLLDTQVSMAKFREILKNFVFSDTDSRLEEIRQGMEKRCRLEDLAESQRNAIKQERLAKQEREEKRKKKPEGQEVIITSDVEICSSCHCFSCSCVQPSINHCQDTYQDFITLVNDIYSYQILSINYSSEDISLRKDVCGDLHVKCPLAFLNDEMVQQLESLDKGNQELQNMRQVLGALALAQAITLTHTSLSHEGALSLLQHLKERKKHFGKIEPFRITIFSDRYHKHPKSMEEMKHSRFMREVRADKNLQQFNFRCGCPERCHNFKKAIKGLIFFNDVKLRPR